MTGTQRNLLLASSFAAAVAIPPPAAASVYDRLVFFGDSLADTGTNAFLFDTAIGPPLPPRHAADADPDSAA